MPTVLAACGGFLAAVLWMDLMFDVQIRRAGDRAAAVASIATYYRRVTTDAFPMNRAIAAVMLIAVAGSAVRAFAVPSAGRLVALALAAGPVALALARVVPAAVRLGAQSDPLAIQAALAERIWRDHVVCFVAIAAFTALELCAG